MLDHLDDPQPFTPGPTFREGVDRRRRALRRRHRVVGVALTVAVLAGLTGAALAYAQRRDAAIDRIDVATSPSADGSINVLVVGSDRGLGGQGQRADVLIVARFEADGSVRLLSIPRDLVDERSEQRVNQAYEQGVQALIGTVTRVTGIPLDHYVEIDAAGLTRLVDDLGGLWVSVGFDLRDEFSGLALALSACTRLDGSTTLALLRSRHLEYRVRDGAWLVDGTGDIGRIARTQALIGATLAGLGAADTGPAAIDRVTRVLADHATLDRALTLPRLAALGRRLASAGPGGTETLPVTVTTTSSGLAVLTLVDGADAVLQRYGAPARQHPAGPSPPLPNPIVAGISPC